MPVTWIVFLKVVLKESSVVNRPGREAYHKPPSSAEIENEWSCAHTPPICRCGVDSGNSIATNSGWKVV